jgi:hypothetical protein
MITPHKHCPLCWDTLPPWALYCGSCGLLLPVATVSGSSQPILPPFDLQCEGQMLHPLLRMQQEEVASPKPRADSLLTRAQERHTDDPR